MSYIFQLNKLWVVVFVLALRANIVVLRRAQEHTDLSELRKINVQVQHISVITVQAQIYWEFKYCVLREVYFHFLKLLNILNCSEHLDHVQQHLEWE